MKEIIVVDNILIQAICHEDTSKGCGNLDCTKEREGEREIDRETETDREKYRESDR